MPDELTDEQKCWICGDEPHKYVSLEDVTIEGVTSPAHTVWVGRNCYLEQWERQYPHESLVVLPEA